MIGRVGVVAGGYVAAALLAIAAVGGRAGRRIAGLRRSCPVFGAMM
jgi:hypothetical protein